MARPAKPGAAAAKAAAVDDFELHPRLDRPLAASRPLRRDEPPLRPLRIFTSDPSASRLAGHTCTAGVPYEPLTLEPAGGERGQPRYECLCGRLFELHMIDADGRALAAPRLDDAEQLMQAGYAPSEANPRFHAQMVYAVASQLHADFRRALGREPGWGFQGTHERLKVFPLGTHEENAWYDPEAGELRFGYFERDETGWYSTALMHDIVAHELTHALLDSQRPHFMEPTGPDVWGFHEGFADLMALFQHFRYAGPLKAALAESQGVIVARPGRQPAEQPAHWLARIARQFGAADGDDALRRADRPADQLQYTETLPEHTMGELLLSAVFDAFDTVFRRRTARLRRLATGGSGILPPGAMHPDLLDALAQSAASLAQRFMAVTVRALDFCPPAGLSLGEYLRAMVTADALLVPDDTWGFREALIDAFRARKIVPRHVISLTEDSLRWGPPQRALPPLPALSFAATRFEGGPGRPMTPAERQLQARALGRWLHQPGGGGAALAECGLVMPGDPALAKLNAKVSRPCIEAVDTTCHASPAGDMHFYTVAVVTQRCTVARQGRKPGFAFECGGTLLFGPDGELRMAISKSALGTGRVQRRSEFFEGELARSKARDAAASPRWIERNGVLELNRQWQIQYHRGQRAARGGNG